MDIVRIIDRFSAQARLTNLIQRILAVSDVLRGGDVDRMLTELDDVVTGYETDLITRSQERKGA